MNIWWDRQAETNIDGAEFLRRFGEIDFDALMREQEKETTIIYYDPMGGRGAKWYAMTVYDPEPFGGLNPLADWPGPRLCGDVEAIICAKWGWHI